MSWMGKGCPQAGPSALSSDLRGTCSYAHVHVYVRVC